MHFPVPPKQLGLRLTPLFSFSPREIRFRMEIKENQDLDLKLVKGREKNAKSHLLSVSCMPIITLILFFKSSIM